MNNQVYLEGKRARLDGMCLDDMVREVRMGQGRLNLSDDQCDWRSGFRVADLHLKQGHSAAYVMAAI